MEVHIRTVKQGNADTLAYIQIPVYRTERKSQKSRLVLNAKRTLPVKRKRPSDCRKSPACAGLFP